MPDHDTSDSQAGRLAVEENRPENSQAGEAARSSITPKRMGRPGKPPDVWGVAEIMARYGVARQTVYQWTRRKKAPLFPPARRLASGAVWDADAVRNWKRQRDEVESQAGGLP